MNRDLAIFVIASLIFFAITLIIIGLIAVRQISKPRGLARPDLDRMRADHTYFRRALHRIFQERGYKITGWKVLKDPLDREPRELVFALRRGESLYCVFCLRWVEPVTSDAIERLEKARKLTRARYGFIVTTGNYTPAAMAQASGLSLELFNRDDIVQWIDSIWPK